MRQPRRSRYDGYTHEQGVRALADDVDEIEGVLDEHIEEDAAAFASSAETFQAWKLESVRAQNRMMFAIIILLLTVIGSLVVPLVTR